MTPKASKVLRGFMDVSDADRAEIIQEINKFQGAGTATRQIQKNDTETLIKRSDNTVNFGPAPGGCPCCGR